MSVSIAGEWRNGQIMSNAPKSLMSYYRDGALVSRELHDLMYQYAADARFDMGLSSYEDRYELMRRIYMSKLRKEKT